MNVVQHVAKRLNVSEYTVFSLAANQHFAPEFVSASKDYQLYLQCRAIPGYVVRYARAILGPREDYQCESCG